VETWRSLLALPVELGAWPAGMGKGKGEGGLLGLSYCSAARHGWLPWQRQLGVVPAQTRGARERRRPSPAAPRCRAGRQGMATCGSGGGDRGEVTGRLGPGVHTRSSNLRCMMMPFLLPSAHAPPRRISEPAV
jgi:hypothetical protein